MNGTFQTKSKSVKLLTDVGVNLMGHDFEASIEVVSERLRKDAAYVIDSRRAREELGYPQKVSLK